MPLRSEEPGRHPLPSGDLSGIDLPLKIVPASWFRFHKVAHDCLNWGLNPRRPHPFRFDAPKGEYGVLYVGQDHYAAFIETFGHNTGAMRRLSRADVASRRLSRVDTARPLQLVDLTGSGLATLGADTRLIAGDYAIAQEWSLAFFNHPQAPDGLYYSSRHDDERRCAAIFDRAAASIAAFPIGTLDAPLLKDLLADMLKTYKFGYSDV